ncbi:MAG: flavodoxin family protein [Candidatus Heimdallarchaeota archaeon]|nr:flavodoxin family protein [Candidatus Heimdallarchaeota archaeon]
MTKVLIFNGSPRRNGNTSTLIKECVRAINKSGKEAEIFFLNDMTIKPCQFCDWCIDNNVLSCVEEDDMHELYPKLLESDVIIFAAPIFWFNVSAQMKIFIDRLYAFHGKGGFPLTQKKIGTILVYGDNDVETSGVNNAIGTMKDIISYMKSEDMGIVHGTAYKIGDAEKNTELMKQAYDLGLEVSK